MTSAIFEDVSRSYFEYKIIAQPMKNILDKFHANIESILSCYLIIALLSDPPQAKIYEKWQNLVKSKC